MKKRISRRTLMVSSVSALSAIAIGVPAAVVFATKEDVSRDQISQNIQTSLEQKLFGTMKLLPTDQDGVFNKAEVKTLQTKLAGDRVKLQEAAVDYIGKSLPDVAVYGTFNDVITVYQRFNNFKAIQEQVVKVVTDIKAEDWGKLDTDLFGTDDNGLLSRSYGIGTGLTAKDAFTSFGEYVDKLKDDTSISALEKAKYLNTILGPLGMMLGKDITASTDPTTIKEDDPAGSIAYLLSKIDPQSKDEINTLPASVADYRDQLKENVLKAWSSRYKDIDDYYNDRLDPSTTSATLDTLVAKFNGDAMKDKGLSTAIEKYTLDNAPINNFEFLQLVFGVKNDGTNIVVDDSNKQEFNLNNILKKGIGISIDASAGKTHTKLSYAAYYSAVIQKLFNNQGFDLFKKLSTDTDMRDAYKELVDANAAYDTDKLNINKARLAIGVKLDDFKNILESYKVSDKWDIQVQSFKNSKIDQDDFDAAYAEYTKLKVMGTLDSRTVDGYFFPSDSIWTFRHGDLLELENVNFEATSHLSQFQDIDSIATLYKSYVRIDEISEVNEKSGIKAPTVNILIEWDHIKDETKGGSDDK